jgi:hypothetical protein
MIVTWGFRGLKKKTKATIQREQSKLGKGKGEASNGGEGCRSARRRGVRPPSPPVRRRPPAVLPRPPLPASTGGLGDGGRPPRAAAGGGGGPRSALLPVGFRVPPLPLGHQLLLLLARPPFAGRILACRLRPHPPL